MNYKEYFGPYALEQNKFLKGFFLKKRSESRKTGASVAPKMLEEYEKFLGGGKRMRGGLVKLGYESFGGKKLKSVLPVSAAIELTHAALLIHDDVIDQDILRHGHDTVHITYRKYHKAHYKKGDSLHYGESMAICTGWLGLYEGIQLISGADFDPERKTNTLTIMSNIIVNTAYGEALDVDLSSRNTILEKDILTINRLKTAWYTIVGPLSLGAALTGAGAGRVKIFENYGLPLGIAFQLQDDILGMFGNSKKTGKSAASDIKEGKNTLLYLYALRKGNRKQQQRLKNLWGKRDITLQEVKEARKIVVETGSRAYCEKRAKKLVEEAKLAVPKLTKNKKLREVYLTLADYIVEREN